MRDLVLVEDLMTEDRLPLAELLQKAGDSDFLRAVAEAVLQLLMESDVEGLIGAGRYERSAERLNYRNGYRERAPARPRGEYGRGLTGGIIRAASATGRSTAGSARSSCGCRSCARAPTSRPSSSPGR